MTRQCTLVAILSLAVLATSSSAFSPRAECGTDPDWALTPTSYVENDVHFYSRDWWSQQPTNENLVRQMAAQVGDDRSGLACGINKISSCTIAGCDPFDESDDPPWTYIFLQSVSNLNSYFNAIHEGIADAQLDFTNQIPSLIADFFESEKPSNAFVKAAPWISAAFGVVLGTGQYKNGIKDRVLGPWSGVLALAEGGINYAQDLLEPEAPSILEDLEELNDFILRTTRVMAKILEDWAEGAFLGTSDLNGKNIFDYLNFGSFVDARVIPKADDIRRIFTAQFIARMLNAKFRAEKQYFVMCNSAGPADQTGRTETRYYSTEGILGMCHLYSFISDGDDDFKLELPADLPKLQNEFFNITGSDITQSSVGAFAVSGNNWTSESENQAITDVIGNRPDAFNTTAWPGVWNIPVCDTGNFNWQTQQLGDKNKGMLPCCCGDGCADTAQFSRAMRFNETKSFLGNCWEQMNNTSIDPDSIDYGVQSAGNVRATISGTTWTLMGIAALGSTWGLFQY